MINEVKRLQQLAGINEIKINDPKYPHFDKWKKDVIKDFDGDDDFDRTTFNKITDPYRAIQYLRLYGHFVDSDEVIKPNINYIKYGKYLNEIKINKPLNYQTLNKQGWNKLILDWSKKGNSIRTLYKLFNLGASQSLGGSAVEFSNENKQKLFNIIKK